MVMRMRVLLVDDEEEILSLLEMSLEELGYESRLARNGAEALEILRTEQVDAVVTDVMMPEMDGLMLATQVKEEYPDVRVIGMSGTMELRVENTPFDAFLRKPFSFDALRKAIAGEGE